MCLVWYDICCVKCVFYLLNLEVRMYIAVVIGMGIL